MTNKKRFERIYEDVDVFCRDHNAKGISQLIEREDYDTIVDLLNELADENEQLKSENQQIRDTINEMYETERTALGRSVLKQLLEVIQ